jgi:protein-S-isoprenylcysteine O-methyltransferase Ste14
VFVSIGSCVYAGLAIFGWAGFRSFFSHLALIALIVVLFALPGMSFFAGGNLVALLHVAPLISRIGAEESLLRAHFGHEYSAYCSRTWCLVPGIY